MTDLRININSLPKSLQEEVADFVASLKNKLRNKTKLDVRQFGYAKGEIKLSADFDEPLKEFKNYM